MGWIDEQIDWYCYERDELNEEPSDGARPIQIGLLPRRVRRSAHKTNMRLCDETHLPRVPLM